MPEYRVVDPERNDVTAHKVSQSGTYECVGTFTDRIEFATGRLHAEVDLK